SRPGFRSRPGFGRRGHLRSGVRPALLQPEPGTAHAIPLAALRAFLYAAQGEPAQGALSTGGVQSSQSGLAFLAAVAICLFQAVALEPPSAEDDPAVRPALSGRY